MNQEDPASSFSPYTRNHLQPAQIPDMSQDELSGLSHAQMLHLFNSWPKDQGKAQPGTIDHQTGVAMMNLPQSKDVEMVGGAAPPKACDPKCSMVGAAQNNSRNADHSVNGHSPQRDNTAPAELMVQNKTRQSPGRTRQEITQSLNQMIDKGQPYPESGLQKFAQASLQHISPALKHHFEQTGKWPTQQEQQVAALRALNFELDQRERIAGQKRSFNAFAEDMHDSNVPPLVNTGYPRAARKLELSAKRRGEPGKSCNSFNQGKPYN